MEIDSVTQRARNAETAFLEMYQKLGLAPDPVPLMENVIVRFFLLFLTQCDSQ